MKRSILFILAMIVLVTFLSIPDVAAQCPMCKMSAESNLRDGGSANNGLNTGILYMFCLPYLLVGTLALAWYKNKKKYE